MGSRHLANEVGSLYTVIADFTVLAWPSPARLRRYHKYFLHCHAFSDSVRRFASTDRQGKRLQLNALTHSNQHFIASSYASITCRARALKYLQAHSPASH
jgi:hypothetical protein